MDEWDASSSLPGDASLVLQASTKISVESVTSAIVSCLREAADVGRAGAMTAYMRGKFEFFGVCAQNRRNCLRDVLKQHGFGCRAFVKKHALAISRLLYKQPQRECHQAAVDVLMKHVGDLGGISALPQLKFLLQENSWWDTVDMLSTNVVGPIVFGDLEEGRKVMDKWISHEDMWLRRCAIIHQLKYKGNTDEAVLFRYCLQRADERKFFIEKAIGWALRQYARENAEAVQQFVATHETRFASLTKREALKHVGPYAPLSGTKRKRKTHRRRRIGKKRK